MLYVAADVPEPTTVIVWSVLGVAGAVASLRRRRFASGGGRRFSRRSKADRRSKRQSLTG